MQGPALCVKYASFSMQCVHCSVCIINAVLRVLFALWNSLQRISLSVEQQSVCSNLLMTDRAVQGAISAY